MEYIRIVSVALFIIIGLILLYILNIILLPEWVTNEGATLSTRGIYEEEKNSLDVVFVGSSNIYNGISPLEIWEETGIPSYSYGSPEQKIWLSYYAIKEVLAYQKPKIIMLDVNEAFSNDYLEEDNIRKLLDNMKFGKAKLEAINDKMLNYDSELSYIFPIIRYHTRWNSLTKKDFQRLFLDYKSTYKGYVLSKQVTPFEGNTNYLEYTEKTDQIQEVSKKYLDKIVELCQEKGTELILIDMPSPHSWTYPRHKAISDYAESKEVEFLELNCVDEIGIDWSKDTPDGGWHLNVNGASKVSKYIAKYLQENYNLTDYRENPNYSEWNNDLEKYLKDKEN